MGSYGIEEIVFFMIDKKLNVKYITDNVKDIVGIDKGEILNKNICEVLIREDTNRCTEKLENQQNKPDNCIIKVLTSYPNNKMLEVGFLLCRETDNEIYGYIVDVTEKHKDEELFKVISEVAPIGIFFHIKGKFIFVNKKLSEILEYPQEELLKSEVQQLKHIIHPEDWPLIEKYLNYRMKGIKKPADYVIRIITKNKIIKWVRINSDTIYFRGLPSAIGTVEDITRQIALENAYKTLIQINKEGSRTKDIQTFFRRVSDIFLNTDYFNTVMIEEVRNKKKVILMIQGETNLSEITPNYERQTGKISAQKLDISSIYKYAVSIPIFVKEKLRYIITLFSKEVFELNHKELKIFEEIAEDISLIVSYIHREQDLYKKEYYDNLTGIGNRKLLYETIDELISASKEFYLILVDIHNFRWINELFGMSRTDKILKDLALLLKKMLKTKYIFRSGSDEFAVLWEGNIYTAIDKIRAVFKIPMFINSKVISLSYNAGIVHYPSDGKFRMELILKAERTLQQAKEEGKDIIRFHDENLYKQIKHFFEIEEKIDSALTENRFFIELQPIVSFNTNRVVLAEALIRMKDRKGNVIPPSEFIPVAEKTGQIMLIESLVIRKCNKLLQKWKKNNRHPVKISINITPTNLKTIYETFTEDKSTNFIKNEFSLSEIKEFRENIIFELTEREFLEITQLTQQIKKLKEKGFMFSIDDFGTGYSSLSYLSQLNIDYLKIDLLFTQNMLNDPKTYKIVQSIVSIAKTFGIKTIAEGVETKEQYKELKKLGCDFYQGYFFSPPLPVEQFEKLIS